MTWRSTRSFAKGRAIDPGPIVPDPPSDDDIDMIDEGDAGYVDEAMEVIPDDDEKRNFPEKLIIAVDFGTTFSSVAYVRIGKDKDSKDINPRDIISIENYPDYTPPEDAAEIRRDVPTELWYDPDKRQKRQVYDTAIIQDQASSAVDEGSSSDSDSSSDSEGSVANQDPDQELERRRTFEVATQHAARARLNVPYWGFGVQSKLSEIDIPKDDARRVSRFKLLLDRRQETETVRTELAPMIKSLKRLKLIKGEEDLFFHYLSHLLNHTKKELSKRGELAIPTAFEFVVCVPAKWPAKACRIMQTAMEQAVREINFGPQANNSVRNLFLISEPEAAAACVLAENLNDAMANENIVILDAGGGTVDGVTYLITQQSPLRLLAEVVKPDSQLCGSSYINERFENLLLEKLKDERYLAQNGQSIRSIVEAQTIKFENRGKRVMNPKDDVPKGTMLEIPYLRPDPSRGLYQNRLKLSRHEAKELFRESLDGAWNVLKSQLELAKMRGCSVAKVILTGGFGQSKALQEHLKNRLKKQKNLAGVQPTLLVSANYKATAVAVGAVLRALNKADGPERISQCSYGFLLNEKFNSKEIQAHKVTKSTTDQTDGCKYVTNVLNWTIKKDHPIPNGTEYSVWVKRMFSSRCKYLRGNVQLYVSDQRHESHYKKGHASNKGAELAGDIVVDLTFLKDEGLIQPKRPTEDSIHLHKQSHWYWEIEFDVLVIVEGRNLRYEARWPSKQGLIDGEQTIQTQRKVGEGQICIAAAFQPGTE